ncbi:MAG TPA: multiubiquitin domain-containing protein [Candidatus Thermoplasmatota archaeon]|nr:multiubiquitin domain-containing protein [Candidatus Thermoplasmatota archaeon]
MPDSHVDPVLYIDGQPVSGVPAPQMTGAQILAAAGHDADIVDLYAEGHHGQRIGPEQAVPVQDGSRFVTRRRR